MTEDVSKAINNLSKRLNEVERKLDQYFLEKHKINSRSIEDTDTAVMELAKIITSITGEEDTING